MGVKIQGLDQLQKRLKQMEQSASSLNGSHSVSFNDLFTKKFMNRYTDFSIIDEFVEKSGFDFSDMESIDEADLDSFVNENTQFESWNKMKTKAAEEWTARQLGF
ncbi:hypothetical protein [Enterococcus sp. 2201sp1_2201st1_B8_2201SCRN_220225]|uniref:hypothetical protein n=1 Tax=unclassified Enterococcus TaxID=2608891 RepID=UPI0034A2F0FA